MKLAFYIGRTETNPSARLFDLAVCWLTNGDFSHVELVLDGPDHAATCWSSSYRDGGVRKKVIDLTSGHWVLVEIGGDPAKAEQWFKDHEGQGYDKPGLFGFVLPWRTEDRLRWFCSEACVEALEYAGAFVEMLCQIEESWRYSPNKLFDFINQPGGRYAGLEHSH